MPMEIEPLHPLQIERFRAMSFREKMAVSRILAVQSELSHMDFLSEAIRERGLQAAWEEARTGI